MAETFEQKTQRNIRAQARYDELMREGKHGHYETMFQVIREEVELERECCGRIAESFTKDYGAEIGSMAKRIALVIRRHF